MSADQLLRLLAVEHALALGQSPFKCDDNDCPYYGKTVPNRGCQCFDEHKADHRAKVRRALSEVA